MSSHVTAARPVRNFRISDAALIAFARVYHAMFLDDAAEFAGLNPDFSNNFAANWLNAIEAAEAMPADETIVDIQVQQTDRVNQVMAACRRKYKQILYYADEALGTVAANEFGRNTYLAVRVNPDAMVTFMGNLWAACTKYASALATQGLTQLKIDEIAVLQIKLSEENAKHSQLVKQRGTHTAGRINAFNLVYDFCRRVNRASKVLFAEDRAKLQKYMLAGSENEEKDVSFTGVVTSRENNEPVVNATVELANGLTAATDEFGVFAFTENIDEGEYKFTVKAKGYKNFTGFTNIVPFKTATEDPELMRDEQNTMLHSL